MNRLSVERRAMILNLLVRKHSLRDAAETAETDVHTVQWFMEDLGQACLKFHHEFAREIPSKAIEVDEMHAFVYARDKNLPPDMKGKFGYGSVYTWIAIDADTKFIPSWHVGRRESSDADIFIHDLASRLKGRIQLSSDGFQAYLPQVHDAFGTEIDYGHLLKIFDDSLEKITAKEWLEQASHDQPSMKATRRVAIFGNPDPHRISTAYIERFNRTVRMALRRYTRSDEAHSKKFENHRAMTAVFMCFYNLCRIHSSIRVTPAMEAGLTGHVWKASELVRLLD